MYHTNEQARKSSRTNPQSPRFVRFVSPMIVGQANSWEGVGGGDPTLEGWAGVMAACDLGAVPIRSEDGDTLFLVMDGLTNVNWWGRA